MGNDLFYNYQNPESIDDESEDERLDSIEESIKGMTFQLKGKVDFSDNQYLYTRRIILSGEIDEQNIKDVTEKMFFLEHENKRPVTLIIDSYGGDVYSSLFLADLIQTLKLDVSTIVIGKAMSAGFIIAIAGKKGKRFITQNATMMNHQISAEAMGKVSDMEIEVIECKRLEKLCSGFILKYTKCPKNVMAEMKKKDVHFTAKECVKYGFVDKMIRELP